MVFFAVNLWYLQTHPLLNAFENITISIFNFKTMKRKNYKDGIEIATSDSEQTTSSRAYCKHIFHRFLATNAITCGPDANNFH